jgi:hypothetical protein
VQPTRQPPGRASASCRVGGWVAKTASDHGGLEGQDRRAVDVKRHLLSEAGNLGSCKVAGDRDVLHQRNEVEQDEARPMVAGGDSPRPAAGPAFRQRHHVTRKPVYRAQIRWAHTGGALPSTARHPP